MRQQTVRARRPLLRGLAGAAAVTLAMVAPGGGPHAQGPAPDTVIGFDEPGLAGQNLGTQYQSRGVVFTASAATCNTTPQVRADGAAFSPPQDARLPQCAGGGDTLASGARLDYAWPRSRVSVRIHNGDSDGTPPPVQVVGTDENGATVASASVSAPNSGWATAALAQPAGEAPRIRSVFIARSNDGGSRLDIDELTFDNPSGGPAPPPAPPTRPPTASFAGGPSNNLRRTSILDGSRSSAGAGRRIVRYDWNFDGDKSFDISCDGDTPLAFHPYPTAGAKNVVLRVTDSAGATSTTTGRLSVARNSLARSRISSTVGGCQNDGRDDRPNTSDDCTRAFSVLIYDVEARTGCIKVETLEFRRRKVSSAADPKGRLNKPEYLSRMRATVDGPLNLNGLNLQLPKGVKSTIDTGNDAGTPGSMDIDAARAFLGGAAAEASGPLLGRFSLRREFNFQSVARASRDHVADISLPSSFSKIGGFGIKGKAGLDFGHHTSEVTLHASIPLFKAGPGGGPVTGDIRLTAENHVPFRIEDAQLRIPSAYLGPVRFQNVFLDYTRKNEVWRGGGRATIPATDAFIDAQAGFVNGAFNDASLEAGFPTPGVALGPTGAFLTNVRLQVSANPLTLGGGLSIAAGPKRIVRVDGNLLIQIDDPWFIRATGAGYLNGLPLADATVTYNQAGDIGLDGSFSVDFLKPLVSYSGEFSGFVQGSAMSLEGTGRGCLLGWCPRLNGIVTNRGLAACGGVDVWGVDVGLGFGFRWPDPVIPVAPVVIAQVLSTTSILFPSCDLSGYRVAKPRASAAAVGEQLVPIEGGQRVAAISVRGAGALPSITLIGPKGERVDTPADRSAIVKNSRFLLLQNPRDNTVYIAIRSPSAGTWKVSPKAGAPVTPLAEVRQANGLPKPSVKARVSGKGERRKVSYRVRSIPGQRVTFAEKGLRTHRAIGRATKARGSFRFKPGQGSSGRRTIIALVEQGGVPRDQLVVGRYTASRPPRLARPRRVRVKRRGRDLVVAWRRVPGARAYSVLVKLNDGRRTLITTSSRRRRAIVTRVGKRTRGTVSVAGLTRVGRPGHNVRVRVKVVRNRR